MVRRLRLIVAVGASTLMSIPTGAQQDPRRAEACTATLAALAKAEIIYDLGVEPAGIRVVVDGATWASLDFQAKTRMVQLVVCTITGGDASKTGIVNVFDHLNNHVVGRYDGRKLTVPGG